MKKILFLTTVVAVFAACSKETPTVDVKPNPLKGKVYKHVKPVSDASPIRDSIIKIANFESDEIFTLVEEHYFKRGDTSRDEELYFYKYSESDNIISRKRSAALEFHDFWKYSGDSLISITGSENMHRIK